MTLLESYPIQTHIEEEVVETTLVGATYTYEGWGEDFKFISASFDNSKDASNFSKTLKVFVPEENFRPDVLWVEDFRVTPIYKETRVKKLVPIGEYDVFFARNKIVEINPKFTKSWDAIKKTYQGTEEYFEQYFFATWRTEKVLKIQLSKHSDYEAGAWRRRTLTWQCLEYRVFVNRVEVWEAEPYTDYTNLPWNFGEDYNNSSNDNSYSGIKTSLDCDGFWNK